MAQILIRNLSPSVVERLKQRARLHHRSLEAEVREILEGTAVRELTPAYQGYLSDLASGKSRGLAMKEFLKKRQATSLPQTTDSADLVREDRERADS